MDTRVLVLTGAPLYGHTKEVNNKQSQIQREPGQRQENLQLDAKSLVMAG